MISKITRCIAPYYVQFELTRRCNNRCFFCYNEIGNVGFNELSTEEIIRVIDEMAIVGVFKINFNGGEPLSRSDFLKIVRHAYEKNFQLHMNTNATLMTEDIAKEISKFMKSVCVSILSSRPEIHDSMSGRKGAFEETLRGMDILKEQGMSLEVNVCTTSKNYKELPEIAEIATKHGCKTLCSTRYILSHASQAQLCLGCKETIELIDILLSIKKDYPILDSVALPGPVPFCEVPKEYTEKLKQLNIPCQFAYGLCRISPTGKITPCPLSNDVIGDLRQNSFVDIWNSTGWEKYEELIHIPNPCRQCQDFHDCKAGCIMYDQCLCSNGLVPHTKKWQL